MLRQLCSLAIGASILSVVIPAANGQAAAINGEITGVVTDAAGGAVANAALQVVNTATEFMQFSRTESSGLYRFPLLPIGNYEIKVTASGFADSRVTGITLNAGATFTLNITLQLARTTTQVDVTASSAAIEPGRTAFGSMLDYSATSNLPLVSRNPYNFILFQPNVSGRANTEFGVPRKVNANGFNGRINYQLDGSNNTESDRSGIRLIPISNTYVEEVQQVSNGFAPEFGNTVGTVFNTITKSGTNDFHGEAAYMFRRTPFSARPKLLPAAAPSPEVNVGSYVLEAGGRILRDKLFYFGSFEHVNRDLPAPVTVPASVIAQLGLPSTYADTIPFRQSVYFYMGRADWIINASNRLLVRYNHHANDSPYNYSLPPGGQNLVSRTYNFVDRSHVGALQLISTLSSSAVNELRAQVAKRSQANDRFAATGTGPAITVAGVANFGGPIDVGFAYTETAPEIVESFSLIHGSHEFKTGFSSRWIRDEQVAATGALYVFPTIAAYLAATSGADRKSYASFTQALGNSRITYDSLFVGGFAQDSWRPRRDVTVIYGVRYDVYRPPDADRSAPFPHSQSFRTDRNNFAPRLGIAWSLGKQQKTVIRAYSGIFYDPFQTDQYRLALLQNGLPHFLRISALPIQPFAPAFPDVLSSLPTGLTLPVQDLMTVSPDFATLYSYNASVSISREIARNLVASASYLYTKGTRLPVYRNLNVVPSGAYLADGRPIFSTTARVYPGFNNILSAESAGNSNYNGLNVTIEKRWGRIGQLFGTYTWSHAIDDAPEQNNIDSTAFLSDSTNRHRDRADSLTDKRHVFNMTAVFQPEFRAENRWANRLLNGNMFALTVQAASGDLFNIGSNRVLNLDSSEPAAYQRPLFIGRNTLRGPAIFELNARYSRFFPISDRYKLEVFAETTNLPNRLNATTLNSTAIVDPAGVTFAPASRAITAARDQRLVQMGLRWQF
jgi:hypothetical protein